MHHAAVVNCQYSMATFSTNERKRRPRGDLKSTEMTLHLKQAMQASIKTELYPYSQIDIYLEVLGCSIKMRSLMLENFVCNYHFFFC